RRWPPCGKPAALTSGSPTAASVHAYSKRRKQMSAEAMTYETAVERLEEIIRRLDSNQAGLRETLELCQEGKGVIEFAAGELDAVGHGLQELKLDDLVARLEASPG